MMLIADSGSTKTSWVLLNSEMEKKEFDTSGFNPYIQKKDQILYIIKEEVYPNLMDISVKKIYFYGAGCSTDANKNLMLSCFQAFFKNANIEIEHDLLAAARALWFDKKGIVAILGTGSNSCVYDGKSIIKSVPSLGYILGDEGSGAYMGKKLITDFLYRQMPEAIQRKFASNFKLDITNILDHIYKYENPNRWLASFSVFINENINEKYCEAIVANSMRDFFEAHIKKYQDYSDFSIGVIGSIGYYYKDFFENMANVYGFTLKKVIKSPIDELVRYHIINRK